MLCKHNQSIHSSIVTGQYLDSYQWLFQIFDSHWFTYACECQLHDWWHKYLLVFLLHIVCLMGIPVDCAKYGVSPSQEKNYVSISIVNFHHNFARNILLHISFYSKKVPVLVFGCLRRLQDEIRLLQIIYRKVSILLNW